MISKICHIELFVHITYMLPHGMFYRRSAKEARQKAYEEAKAREVSIVKVWANSGHKIICYVL